MVLCFEALAAPEAVDGGTARLSSSEPRRDCRWDISNNLPRNHRLNLRHATRRTRLVGQDAGSQATHAAQ